MTAATVTINDGFIPSIRKGSISAANDYTTSFGFSSCEGAVLTNSDDDEFASITAISSGVVTLGLVDDGGSAVTTARTIYFIAWGKD